MARNNVIKMKEKDGTIYYVNMSRVEYIAPSRCGEFIRVKMDGYIIKLGQEEGKRVVNLWVKLSEGSVK